MGDLYRKHNYLNRDISYLNGSMREYDMVDAGFNILKEYGLVSYDTIKYLGSLDKMSKNIEIGKMTRWNKDLNKRFILGFVDVRRRFFEANNIDDSTVLAIKKDAIFLRNKIIRRTVLNSNINFKLRHKFTSYLNINNVELYYSSYEDLMVVKNIGSRLYLFKDNLLVALKNFMKLKEKSRGNDISMYTHIKNFRDDYVNLRLDESYYREFNKDALYRVKIGGATFGMDHSIGVEHLDLAFNYHNILVPMINLFV